MSEVYKSYIELTLPFIELKRHIFCVNYKVTKFIY